MSEEAEVSLEVKTGSIGSSGAVLVEEDGNRVVVEAHPQMLGLLPGSDDGTYEAKVKPISREDGRVSYGVLVGYSWKG